MDIRKELCGLAYGLAVTLLVTLALELATVADVRDVSPWALLAVLVRSACSAVLAHFGKEIPGVSA